MIHKFQNIHGICYTVPPDLKEYKKELEQLIKNITEDKKLPFTDVYVKMPVFWFQRFVEALKVVDMDFKEAGSRHGIFLIKF